MSDKLVDIIKGALLLELKGRSFYENVANQTKNDSVKEVFETMAAEEQKHIAILSEHYTSLITKGKIEPREYEERPVDVASSVLVKKVQNEINAADYEAAAISAAMAMEEKAVEYYSGRAENSKDENEAALFRWLANWERTHLQFLNDLDRELRDKVWQDSNFWPM